MNNQTSDDAKREDVTAAARAIADQAGSGLVPGSRVVVIVTREDGEFVGVASNTTHADVLAILDSALNGHDCVRHPHTASAEPIINVVVKSPTPSAAMSIWIRMNKAHAFQVYDYRAWQTVLELLARKPPEALERALVAYESDAWVLRHSRRATPGHLLMNFERYAEKGK